MLSANHPVCGSTPPFRTSVNIFIFTDSSSCPLVLCPFLIILHILYIPYNLYLPYILGYIYLRLLLTYSSPSNSALLSLLILVVPSVIQRIRFLFVFGFFPCGAGAPRPG